ncbi:MAG: hypothetical protein HYW63_01845 [Candidatus Levybacteria bacterium]|nr:hypothetical protein [Candidatus Levybacteria bacterium]
MPKLTAHKMTIVFLFILVLAMIPSIYSLFPPGFFESDDGEWMVIRFSAFYQALLDGQFPVRFLGRLNYGYGYPVANFLYPGFMYLATPFQILGLGFVNSVKLMLIASMLGGGLFTYLWLSKLFDRVSSLIGAIAYTYTPYHLFDLYKRGSVGEILSLSVLPFILWQLERRSIFFTSVGIFFLILAHNTLAILFLLFVISYMSLNIYVSKKKKSLIFDYLVSLLLGIGMASFFWIPAILELRFTVFSSTKVSQWQNYFADINLIGLSTFVIFVTILILIFSKKIRVKEHRLTLLLLFIGLLSVFLSSPSSSIVWKALPVSFVQFPFRFLSLIVPSSAFLAACAVSVSHGKSKTVLIGILITSIFLSSIGFLTQVLRTDKTDPFYSTNEATTTVADEYMPPWVEEKPVSRFGSKIELGSEEEIISLVYNSKRIYFETSNQTEAIARINTIYYPGWEAKINRVKTDIRFDNPKGVMEISLPEGKSSVELNFKETPVRLLSDLISASAFFVLIILSRKKWKL